MKLSPKYIKAIFDYIISSPDAMNAIRPEIERIIDERLVKIGLCERMEQNDDQQHSDVVKDVNG